MNDGEPNEGRHFIRRASCLESIGRVQTSDRDIKTHALSRLESEGTMERDLHRAFTNLGEEACRKSSAHEALESREPKAA